MSFKLLKYVLILLLLFTHTTFAENQVPTLTRWATDLTNTLSNDELTSLNFKLKLFEDSTSTQIVFLMINTLDGYPVEDYAYETAAKNKIGQKGKDNGILFLVVKDDKVVRIEVGYGLEGALPDAIASSIIRNEIIPYFKKGDYYTGINSGIQSIFKAVAGEYQADEKSDEPKVNIQLILFVIFILLSLLFPRRRRGIFYTGGFGGFGGGGFSGRGFGGSGFGGFSGGGGSFGGGGASGRW